MADALKKAWAAAARRLGAPCCYWCGDVLADAGTLEMLVKTPQAGGAPPGSRTWDATENGYWLRFCRQVCYDAFSANPTR